MRVELSTTWWGEGQTDGDRHVIGCHFNACMRVENGLGEMASNICQALCSGLQLAALLPTLPAAIIAAIYTRR